jgi:hypothetical protein
MRAVLASLLLRECLHPGALAGTQGGVQGGCCQAEGSQGGIFVVALIPHYSLQYEMERYIYHICNTLEHLVGLFL